jgi:hypothetical protein
MLQYYRLSYSNLKGVKLMEEARVMIDLKEGIIELEGPIDFVRHYLEMYRPAVKRLSRGVTAGRERPKRVSCTAAIRKEIGAGFFDDPRSVNSIKQHLNESGFEFKDNNVRNSLKRLTATGMLGANGKGRGLTYSKPGIDSRKG